MNDASIGPGGIEQRLAEGAGRAGQALQFHDDRFEGFVFGLAIGQARGRFDGHGGQQGQQARAETRGGPCAREVEDGQQAGRRGVQAGATQKTLFGDIHESGFRFVTFSRNPRSGGGMQGRSSPPLPGSA